MDKERFVPLIEYLDTLPKPKTIKDRFACWLSNAIDDLSVLKFEIIKRMWL